MDEVGARLAPMGHRWNSRRGVCDCVQSAQLGRHCAVATAGKC